MSADIYSRRRSSRFHWLSVGLGIRAKSASDYVEECAAESLDKVISSIEIWTREPHNIYPDKIDYLPSVDKHA